MKVNPKTIQALSLIVPKKDIRYYLMNINFELQLDKTILTATNGHVLLTVCINEPNEKVDSFKIPPESFPKSTVDYEVTRGDDGKVYVTNGLVKSEVPQDDGRYPDYRRAIPSQPAKNIEHKSYDPEYLMLFKKASKLLGGTHYPIVHPNDIVDIGLSNVVGVQMPLRYESVKSGDVPVIDVSPAWLEIPQKQPEQSIDNFEQKAA
ncbi:hypothetical protein [Nitrosomonas ureae]|uniref:Uncharacterized protein n=1 Tax=Nitrosomonas ureae TaxID=44577 RepID=A0A286ABV0_9PROT|nr:hypothetical protein [Nitrosomonas ureae]SOD19365.1 hypothetical protein SAMN06297164_2348 [Nitrosomonas ureae]